jgi:hypothetical protein
VFTSRFESAATGNLEFRLIFARLFIAVTAAGAVPYDRSVEAAAHEFKIALEGGLRYRQADMNLTSLPFVSAHLRRRWKIRKCLNYQLNGLSLPPEHFGITQGLHPLVRRSDQHAFVRSGIVVENIGLQTVH